MAVFRLLSKLALSSRLEKARQRRRLEPGSAKCCRLCVEPLEVRTMPAAAGSWQALAPTNPASGPTEAQLALVLSDGTLMIQPQGVPTNAWSRLTPDATGNYATGTWSPLASMNVARWTSSSAMLQDGSVFVLGGDFSSAGRLTNTAEIFNPTAGPQGTWTSVAPIPTPKTSVFLPPGTTASQWGEGDLEVLGNGNVFALYFDGTNTYIYNPSTNTWTAGAQKLHNDFSGQEVMVKLPDGSLLSYDLSGSRIPGVFHAQRYFWNTNQWVDESKVSATSPPQLLSSGTVGNAAGDAFLLPDQQVWFIGGNGNSAYFTPSTDLWSAGPKLPSALYNGVMTQFGATDNPGAMLSNGDVLVALSPVLPRVNGKFNAAPATHIYEFNPTTQTFTDVTPPGLTNVNAVGLNMLVLPTGQVLLTNELGQMQIYTPSGGPVDSWRPTISSIQLNANRSYTLTGTDLNGISEGANTGCYFHMATNYPIVQLRNSSGQVFYARTYNWSSTGVATGNVPETVNFQLPAGLPAGNYSLSVSANGIGSVPIAFTNASGPSLDLSGGFASAAGLLNANGSAAINGSVLRLTDGKTREAGSAFFRTPVGVTNFTTKFNFRLTKATADGFTFTVQGTGPTALGAGGSGLGYEAIANSVAVKFDLYNNAGEGGDSTGLYINGASPTTAGSIKLTNTGIDLHSGHTFDVAMSYDGITLSVSITDLTTNAKATQSYKVNIPSIVGGSTAYVGFTGATGGLAAIQDILSWTYVPALAPPPKSANLAAGTSFGQVRLSWSAADGAATYNVYRSTSPGAEGGAPYKIGLTSPSFADIGLSNGTTYYYEVSSVNSAGESGRSAEITATPQPFVAKINFSNNTTQVPLGYVNDIGRAYGARGNGLNFGWNADNTANARDRDISSSPDERYDSFIHMQKPSDPNAFWEIAVSTGTYSLHLAAGDPSAIDSVFAIAAEGILALSGTPTTANHWLENTVTVTVTDGRLTISNAPGAKNNKIDFIDITQIG
jgi:Legume lectin domain